MYCSDIPRLMTELGISHVPMEWRLFIDSSKVSLKAVLLSNGNQKPSIPVTHACRKERHMEGSMDTIFTAIQYDQFGWSICSDLEVISLLLGLQSGFTKFFFFVCGTVGTSEYYEWTDWPKQEVFIPGENSH